MITALTLGGQPITSTKVLLQSFNNGSFPMTVYTRSKRGGFQGNKQPTPTFDSYQLVINLLIIGSSFSDLAAQRMALAQTFGLVHSGGSQTLVIYKSDGKNLQIDIKTIEVIGDITTDDGVSCQLQVTLNAEYPFLQSTIPTSQDVLFYNGGGMTIPMGVPLNLSHGQSGTVSASNNGNYAAYPLLNFVGPLTNPLVTNQTTGLSLGLAYTLATSGDSILVDCYNRAVTINPSGNVGRQYASGSFFTMPIGTSVLTLTSSNGGDTGKCTVTFRNTYLGV